GKIPLLPVGPGRALALSGAQRRWLPSRSSAIAAEQGAVRLLCGMFRRRVYVFARMRFRFQHQANQGLWISVGVAEAEDTGQEALERALAALAEQAEAPLPAGRYRFASASGEWRYLLLGHDGSVSLAGQAAESSGGNGTGVELGGPAGGG